MASDCDGVFSCVSVMASLAPHLALPVLTDIWLLIAKDYASCCLHITTDGENLDISAVQMPLILSRGWYPTVYPARLLQALISVQCLLNILALSTAKENKDRLLDLFRNTQRWEIFAAVRPQTCIIFTSDYSNNDLVSWLGRRLPSRSDLSHLPEIFAISPVHADNRRSSNAVGFGIIFICWYCTPTEEKHYDRMQLDCSFESFCSSSGRKPSCANVLKQMVATHLVDSGASFWQCDSKLLLAARRTKNVDPFARDIGGQAENKESVIRFLYGNNSYTTGVKSFSPYIPRFEEARGLSCWEGNFHYVGETPGVKFITLSGVIDLESSYDVYFSPFTPQVWFLFLISSCASLMVVIFVVRQASGLEPCGVNRLTLTATG